MSRQEHRRRARAARGGRRRRGRRVAYATLAAVVALFAGWLGIRPLVRSTAVSARGDVHVVQANMAGFQPGVIHAKVGESITVRLESLDTRFHRDGGGRHQFAIDALGVNIIAPPLRSREATFVVAEPGVYSFYCSICCGGKANPAMWGRLIVDT